MTKQTNIFKALKEGITYNTTVNTDVDSLEDAYNTLYYLVERLKDMDDFGEQLLKSIIEKQGRNKSFEESFKEAVNEHYQFANFDYFKDSFDKYKDNLQELLTKAFNEPGKSPTRIWSDEIHWMADHAVINYNGTDMTLEQLRDAVIEGGLTNE